MIKFLRRGLIGLAVLATLAGLFYAEENFRGKRAWDNYRRELEARGEQLDWRSFIPKAVPDDQNFAMTPFLRSSFPRLTSDRWKDNYRRAEDRVQVDKDHRQLTDLVVWERALADTNTNTVRRGHTPRTPQVIGSGPLDLESRAKAAPIVLEALKTNDAMFSELRAASRRPYSRYPINYDVEDPAAILLPHLSGVRSACRRLSLRACAELALGQSGNALEDVKLILYMADSVKEEQFIICYLVRISHVKDQFHVFQSV